MAKIFHWFFMWKMDPMSGFNICLVCTLLPRDSTLQYKRCVHGHLWNNFVCILTLTGIEFCITSIRTSLSCVPSGPSMFNAIRLTVLYRCDYAFFRLKLFWLTIILTWLGLTWGSMLGPPSFSSSSLSSLLSFHSSAVAGHSR